MLRQCLAASKVRAGRLGRSLLRHVVVATLTKSGITVFCWSERSVSEV